MMLAAWQRAAHKNSQLAFADTSFHCWQHCHSSSGIALPLTECAKDSFCETVFVFAIKECRTNAIYWVTFWNAGTCVPKYRIEGNDSYEADERYKFSTADQPRILTSMEQKTIHVSLTGLHFELFRICSVEKVWKYFQNSRGQTKKTKQKRTQWLESASEIYRPSDRSL
jgi:hypothetical protein